MVAGNASVGLVYVYLGGSDGPTLMGSTLQTGIDGDGFGRRARRGETLHSVAHARRVYERRAP
jgi:hypothetical protein